MKLSRSLVRHRPRDVRSLSAKIFDSKAKIFRPAHWLTSADEVVRIGLLVPENPNFPVLLLIIPIGRSAFPGTKAIWPIPRLPGAKNLAPPVFGIIVTKGSSVATFDLLANQNFLARVADLAVVVVQKICCLHLRPRGRVAKIFLPVC